ncbi:unnamed protein product [Caenorhabditis nigoni]
MHTDDDVLQAVQKPAYRHRYLQVCQDVSIGSPSMHHCSMCHKFLSSVFIFSAVSFLPPPIDLSLVNHLSKRPVIRRHPLHLALILTH